MGRCQRQNLATTAVRGRRRPVGRYDAAPMFSSNVSLQCDDQVTSRSQIQLLLQQGEQHTNLQLHRRAQHTTLCQHVAPAAAQPDKRCFVRVCGPTRHTLRAWGGRDYPINCKGGQSATAVATAMAAKASRHGWEWVLKSLWVEGDSRRCRVAIPDTVTITRGSPDAPLDRWLFTSKSGVVAKKKDDNLTVSKLTRKFLGGDAECVCGRLWWRSAGCNDVHLTCVAVCAVSCAVVWARAFCVCVCVSVRMPRSSRTPLAPPSRTSCPVSRSTSS